MRAGYQGDLAVEADGGVHGWCCDPQRPDQHPRVAILVEDRLVMTLVADQPRPDLSVGRMQGFRGQLLPEMLPARPEVMVRVRVRGAGADFGQRILMRPGILETWPTIDRAASRLDALSAQLGGLVRPDSPGRASVRLRAGFVAAGAALRPRRLALALPFVRAPVCSLVLPVGRDPAPTMTRLAAIAPILAEGRAEILAVDNGFGAALALLPAMIANLRSAEGGLSGAIAVARGDWVALLDLADDAASALALLAFLRSPCVLQGGRIPSPGIAVAMPRADSEPSGRGRLAGRTAPVG